MIELLEENTTRKMDALGRISIPKSMRLRFRINEGDSLEFYTFKQDGETYIAMKKFVDVEEKYKIAAEVLGECGYEVPDGIIEKFSDKNSK